MNVYVASSETIALELAIQTLQEAHELLMAGRLDTSVSLVRLVRHRLEDLEAELQTRSDSEK